MIKKAVVTFAALFAVVAYLWSQAIPVQTISHEIAHRDFETNLGPLDQLQLQVTGRPPITFTVPVGKNAKVSVSVNVILTPVNP